MHALGADDNFYLYTDVYRGDHVDRAVISGRHLAHGGAEELLKMTSSNDLDLAACRLYGRAFASGLITEGVMLAWPLVRLWET